MSVNLHILKASGRLEPLVPIIESACSEAVGEVEHKLTLPVVDVVVGDNPAGVIPEIGVGGGAPTAHFMDIRIDPEFPDIEKVLPTQMRSTLTHELAHCARFHACGMPRTLLENVVAEGLAERFDMEINDSEPSLWSTAVSGEALERVKEQAHAELHSADYDHAAWFFGTDPERIPRWAGYSLGYNIVGEHMKRTGKTASELMDVPAGEFV